MNTHLNGQYIYNAPYSPELKPIEHAFSMIRRWIRENEFDDTKSDIELINDSFNLYSVLGDKGHCCNNLFNTKNFKIIFCFIISNFRISPCNAVASPNLFGMCQLKIKIVNIKSRK